MYANNFKILQVLINSTCNNAICELKTKFLREHYISHFWAKNEEEEVNCCLQKSDQVYSNQVFFTKLEAADNFEKMWQTMNLPKVYEQNFNDIVFFDCKSFSSGSDGGSDKSPTQMAVDDRCPETWFLQKTKLVLETKKWRVFF